MVAGGGSSDKKTVGVSCGISLDRRRYGGSHWSREGAGLMADRLGPVRRRTEAGGWKAMPFVIGNETFEKLGAIGTLSNLLVYLTKEFNMSSIRANTILSIFNGTTNFATLIGAFVSDTYWGRFKTIAFASVASLMVLELCLDKAAILTPEDKLNTDGSAANPWRLCSMQQVEEMKCLVRLLPIWAAALVYYIVIVQQHSYTTYQALQCDRRLTKHFEIPAASYYVFLMIAMTIWIPIYDRLVVLFLQRRTGIEGGITVLQRIGIGIVLSVVTMVVSGIVEEHRRKSALKHGLFVSPTSFALLLPQYFLTGLTEAFSAVAIMEFFTMQMPESMRTVAGAIFFLSLSVSNYLGSFVANMVHKATEGKSPWVGGHDLNKNKLDCYYYIIAALGAVNFVYFNLFARHYVLVSKKPGSDNGKGEVQLENPNPIARDSSNEESKA
ncbi:PREDICTED: probable peptide/nitrate transporter At5g62680-like [Fragaria vesca subsp. vesca]